jgi:hypothetical protein
MVTEIKVQRKVLGELWDIKVLTFPNGNKKVVAKKTTIYDTVLEVQLEKKEDGMIVPYEVADRLVENELLTELKREMLRIKRNSNTTERNRW